MKKGYVGLLACASGILIGLGISRLDLTGYLEKTQEQEYHPVERKVPESVESKLKDPKQCWLCGSDERSMMDYFRKFDDLGVICTNHWYVMDMHIRNHDEDGNLTGPQGNGHMGYTGTGEGGCFFHTEQMSDYGISEVSVDYGEDSIFDVKKVQNHLCQECLDKLVWDIDGQFVDDNTVTVNISRLKNKLGTEEIANVRGLGYIWTGKVNKN